MFLCVTAAERNQPETLLSTSSLTVFDQFYILFADSVTSRGKDTHSWFYATTYINYSCFSFTVRITSSVSYFCEDDSRYMKDLISIGFKCRSARCQWTSVCSCITVELVECWGFFVGSSSLLISVFVSAAASCTVVDTEQLSASCVDLRQVWEKQHCSLPFSLLNKSIN